MTFLKTLGYTLVVTLLFGFLITQPFLETGTFGKLILFLIFGFGLYFLFKEHDVEEITTRLSMTYIPGAVVILFGITTNILETISTAIVQRGVGITQLGVMANLVTRQNILLNLILLLIGLYGPLYMLRWKEKEGAYKQTTWSILCVAVLYLIGILIAWYINMQLVGQL